MYGDYYIISLPKAGNNIDDGQIKAIARLSMQCA